MKTKTPFLLSLLTAAVTIATTGRAENVLLAQAVPAPAPAAAPTAPPPQSSGYNEAQIRTLDEKLKEADNRIKEANDRVNEKMKEAQERLKSALAQTGFRDRLHAIIKRAGGSTERALVIPKESYDSKAVAETEEDLRVMAHILDKAVGGEDNTTRAMGLPLSRSWGSEAPENLYVEGYGAIFFLNVSFPLQAPPTVAGNTEAREDTDSEWEEARREISEPAGGRTMPVYGVNSTGWVGGPPVPYDAKRVEQLESDIIASLKNAAHIRQLGPDEFITVVVTGPGTPNVQSMKLVRPPGMTGQASGGIVTEGMIVNNATDNASPAKLIIRTMKSDAAAYLKAQMSADEFRKKVTVILY